MANYAQIAEMWAAREREKIASGNLTFYGPVIYSYRTPIGLLVETPKGIVALCCTMQYSSSSSAQQGLVRGAARKRYLTFGVNYCSGPNMHLKNQSGYATEIARIRGAAEKARTSGNAKYYKKHAEKLEKEMRFYEKTFNLSPRAIGPTPKEKAEAEAAERVAFYAADPVYATF
jgi:hypothetical protein